MKKITILLNEYGESHTNFKNQMIHIFCVPLIMWSLLGLFWFLPMPIALEVYPFLNGSVLFTFIALIYYFILDFKYAAVMCFVAVIMQITLYYLFQKNILMEACFIVFVLAWTGQFVGHKIEGKKPSFLKDLEFLLIGPLWVMKEIKELSITK